MSTELFTQDGMDEAFEAADAALAQIDPDADRRTIGVTVTLAVLPKILAMIEPVIEANAVELARAREATAAAVRDMQLAGDRLIAQTNRLKRVFEELDPDAVATQILGNIAEHGPVSPRDHKVCQAATHQTIKTVSQVIGMSLTVDEREFHDL